MLSTGTASPTRRDLSPIGNEVKQSPRILIIYDLRFVHTKRTYLALRYIS